MSTLDLFMLLAAVIGGASALLVVTSRNVVHAALYLVVTLASVAGVFLLAGAEFLAWTQVLVYVGAVVVLILFGLMLTRAPIGPTTQTGENARLALVTSVALFGFLVTLVMLAFGDVTLVPTVTATAALGDVLYTDWAFPFMVLGFFLTVALIGAIIIARREEGEGPEGPEAGAPDAEERRPPREGDATAAPGRPAPTEEVVS